MALTEASNGSLTMNGTEQNLFAAQTTLVHYSTSISMHNMASGDEIIIRVYIEDANGSVERLYIEESVVGVQTEPLIFIPYMPTSSYRVSCEQVAGINRTITWVRHEV